MTDRLDDRLQELGARWRAHQEDPVPVSELRPVPRRRDPTWLVAAVVVAVVIGTTLWVVRGVGGPPKAPEPTATPIRWAPLDPTEPTLNARTTGSYDQILVKADLDRTVEGSDRIAFTVTLTSPTRVSLDPCPDYEISQENSWDDFSTERYALNCAVVPFKDEDGVPYLPAGVGVSFAMEAAAPTASLPVTWHLVTGGEPAFARGRFLVVSSVGNVPRTADFCARLVFDGREYKISTEQTGGGVGRPLGHAAGTACGSGGPTSVSVYSVNEQSVTDGLTASYGGAVVEYVRGDADLVSFPHLEQQVEGLTSDDLALIHDFARFAMEPSATYLEDYSGPEIRMGLGGDLQSVALDRLTDPRTWTFEADGFRGYDGPVNVLDVVRKQLYVASQIIWGNSGPDLGVTVGDHERCAGPPGEVPTSLAGLRHLSIQPTADTIDSCLQWFAIDLYLDGDGRIYAVSLDLWEP